MSKIGVYLLKISLGILKLEREGSFEKNIYNGAKDSLRPLEEFVNSI